MAKEEKSMEWILFLMGIVLFGFAFRLFRKNNKDKNSLRLYGLLSYISLAIAIIGMTLIMKPIYMRLPNDLASLIPSAIGVTIIIIASHFLIKPGFDEKK